MQDVYQQVPDQQESVGDGFFCSVSRALQISVLDVVANVRDPLEPLPIKFDAELVKSAPDFFNPDSVAADLRDRDFTRCVAPRLKPLRKQQFIGRR